MLRSLVRAALDTILPPRCPGTGEVVDAPGMVSAAFWPRLSFIAAPHCATCGLPFGFEIDADALCGACLETPPRYDSARSAVTYNEASRALLLDFKYGDRLHAVTVFTAWLRRAGAGQIAACDLVVPVPLHPFRLWQRRFNQSALLAQALARDTGLACAVGALARRRRTPPQKGLSKSERARNVRAAFAVPDRAAVRGRKILLIDDVYTSGATLNECARALRRAGAAEVHVLTVARVAREEA